MIRHSVGFTAASCVAASLLPGVLPADQQVNRAWQSLHDRVTIAYQPRPAAGKATTNEVTKTERVSFKFIYDGAGDDAARAAVEADVRRRLKKAIARCKKLLSTHTLAAIRDRKQWYDIEVALQDELSVTLFPKGRAIIAGLIISGGGRRPGFLDTPPRSAKVSESRKATLDAMLRIAQRCPHEWIALRYYGRLLEHYDLATRLRVVDLLGFHGRRGNESAAWSLILALLRSDDATLGEVVTCLGCSRNGAERVANHMLEVLVDHHRRTVATAARQGLRLLSRKR